jgi:hypothetical protein
MGIRIARMLGTINNYKNLLVKTEKKKGKVRAAEP